jgi:hypothetical protein
MMLISPLTFVSDYPPEIQAEYYRSQHSLFSCDTDCCCDRAALHRNNGLDLVKTKQWKEII